jgi:hypothetical protein
MRRKLQRHWKPVAVALLVVIVAVFGWAAITAGGARGVTFGAPASHPDTWRTTARPASAVPAASFLGGFALAQASSPSGYATIDVYLTRSALSDTSKAGLVAVTSAQARALADRNAVIDFGKLGPVQGRPAAAFSAAFAADGVRLGANLTRYNLLATDGRVVSVVCRWSYRDARAGQQGCGDVVTSLRLHQG